MQISAKNFRERAALLHFHKAFYVTSSSSSLTSAFNTKPRRLNVNFSLKEHTGLFDIPQLRSPEGVFLLKENGLHEVDELVVECCDPKRKRRMVEIFDDLSNALCLIADLAEFLRIASPDYNFTKACENACVAISNLVEQLNTNRKLYELLKKAVEKGDCLPTTAMDKHVAQLFIFDFEQSGIHLPEAQRQQVVNLNEYILHLGQRFSMNAHEPRQVNKEDLPSHIRHQFALEGENITINGLYTDAANEVAREAAYKIYLYPSEEQEATLVKLLQARHQLAELCGFPSYPHRSLRGSLAENPEMVMDFLDTLTTELKPRAARDYNTMRDLKKETNYTSKELAVWDTPYFTGLARRKMIGHGEDLSPYFSLGSCMEGLDMIFHSLYGIRLQLSPLKPGEAWCPDIYKIDVVHETEGLLGHIYCDFYDRKSKPHQDCHFTIVGGKELPDGTYQNPVVVLMLTLPSPSWGTPSLLTPNMADNLFHEMGHAMHSMLARTRYQHVTGTRCATDLAEVPSILMELFASDPRVVSKFARHYKTGEALPAARLEALCAVKHTFAAAEMQQQVFYSALDQKLHMHPLTGSIRTTTDILQEVQQQYFGLPFVSNTAWQHRFSHVVGYGAKYYSYLLSRGVAAWIWRQYFQEDPFSRGSGEQFRQGFLAHGGSKPARDMVASFLGKDVNPTTLTHSLIRELDDKQETLMSHLYKK
nr:EOG090X02LQ [Ceriodaphnia reticulata]